MKTHPKDLAIISLIVLGGAWTTVSSAPAAQNAEPPAQPTPSKSPNFPTPWWSQEISKKSPSWYRSAEGRRMAENILSWQDHGTGWPLMNTTREPFAGDPNRAGPWGMKASVLKATVNEMRFLARAFGATQEERYRTAVLGGLEYILKAQHPTGGWPHSYPYRMTDYSHYATYNDDVIPDILTFLSEVIRSRDFEFVGKENRTRVQKAFDKGLEFILKSQIVVNGKLTVWAQQHDEVTYEPRSARAFEPAALTGGESAAVLQFLMSVRRPSAGVVKAVEAGVQWYRDAQIRGIEVVRTDNDVIVRPNPSAPPLWARYYEIGTGRPIFAGRDGVIRYNLAEVELERRRGYSWYNRNGTDVLARYEAWQHERQWDRQPLTNIDETKVGDYSLPDPLRTADGKLVTSVADWEQKRRAEILQLFEQHQHGRTPATPVKASYDIVQRDVPGMGGMSRRTQARIRFPDHPEGPVIRVLVNVPANAKGPVPTLLHISFTPNVLLFDEPGIDEGLAWNPALEARIPDREAAVLKDIDPKHFLERGYGIATVYYGDIEPDFDHGGKYGVRSLFKTDGKRKPDEWGAIGAWAWGLSHVMDYLQTVPAVDAKQVALSGVSRLGKTVLWAAAQDKRFAMVIPIVSGEGGAAISRRHFGETIADLTNPARFDYWYAPRYADYAFNVNALPVDGHMLLSLIAPRPVLQIVGKSDTWSDPRGEWAAAQAAEPVYTLCGKTGVKGKDYPEPNKPLLNDMGFFVHDAGHTVLPADFAVMTDFMDRHFAKRAPQGDVTVTQNEKSSTPSTESLSPTERHYLSLLGTAMTADEYVRRRAVAQAAEAEANRRSDEAWARALQVVKSWEAKGKPYIPWAAKPEDLPQAKIPAFPGAWGGGMYSSGGRGGRVFVVTSLKDRGAGTFREACEAGGPRIVVFNVSGLILLKERIRIRAPYITIAGQTAPGKGVCIGGEALEIDTHDVVIRHLRIRRGIVDPLRRNDSVGGHAVGNIMIDHVSASWGSDEVMSLYRHMYQPPEGGPARKLPTVNITIQYSTFAEAVNGSLHGLGATIGGHNSTFHHNLFISNKSRNPSIGMDGDFTFINNVIYNWQDRSIDGGDEKSLYQIINNYFKPGPATPGDHPIRFRILKPEARRGKDVPRDFGKAYVNGNVVEGNADVSRDNWHGGVQLGEGYNEAQILPQVRVDQPFRMSPVKIESAREAFETVLAEVGAALPQRDGHDQRYIAMTRTGTVTLPETQGFVRDINQVGGFSEYGSYHAQPYMDSDQDGMPDAWEIRFKLNPHDASDATGDLNGDGYMNIEKFIYNIDPVQRIDWTKLENNCDTLRALYVNKQAERDK